MPQGGGWGKVKGSTRCRYICPSYANEDGAEVGAAASLGTANYRGKRT